MTQVRFQLVPATTERCRTRAHGIDCVPMSSLGEMPMTEEEKFRFVRLLAASGPLGALVVPGTRACAYGVCMLAMARART